jgi:hypothetical protein
MFAVVSALHPPARRARRRRLVLWILAGLMAGLMLWPSAVQAGEARLTEMQREQVIRDFLAEHPFVHRALPRGRAGVRIEEGKITPTDEQLKQIVQQAGAAARPGQQVRITAVHFSGESIIFEINGGPLKRKSWRDRITVGVGGVEAHPNGTPANDEDIYNGAQGSSVTLSLKNVAPITTTHIKELLEPVLDFKAMNMAEAYQKSLPPKLAEAVKKHHALVGMDKEMVIYAMGRPPRRVRESKDGEDYEEWIYGTPPQDIEFIRFMGDKAVRIEVMKVSGEKQLRTEDEVGELLNVSMHQRPAAVAQPAEAQEERRSAPTLMRPGETQADPGIAARDPHPTPPPMATPPGDTNDPGAQQQKSPFPN